MNEKFSSVEIFEREGKKYVQKKQMKLNGKLLWIR